MSVPFSAIIVRPSFRETPLRESQFVVIHGVPLGDSALSIRVSGAVALKRAYLQQPHLGELEFEWFREADGKVLVSLKIAAKTWRDIQQAAAKLRYLFSTHLNLVTVIQ